MSQSEIEAEERRIRALNEYDVLDTAAEESFDRITRLARLALQMPMAAISLIDRERQWFKSRQGLDMQETPRNVSFCSQTIRAGEPLIVRDALQDEFYRNSPLVTDAPHVRFYCGVALRTPRGHAIGALCVNDTKPRDLTEEQIEALQDLARLVIDELELRKLATSDSLTGALTRRAFLIEAESELARSRRYDRELSCVLLDIDHFKRINDTFGHAAGDHVLTDVIDLCRAEVRSCDTIGRLGGEEFSILLPETDLAAATRLANWLREKIAMMIVTHGLDALHITTSLGVTVAGKHDASFKDTLERADAALYTAKQNGRDRTVVFDAMSGCDAPHAA
jgi:diguanylate cyclase (GGDEF)-like protein